MSVKMGLLALLEGEAAYGYHLKQEFEARTGGSWPVNVGQVYTTLERLERDGHVEREGTDDDGRVLFAITPSGRAEVMSWLASASRPLGTDRSELAVKIALASTLPQVDIAEVIQAHRKAALEQLQELTRAKRADAQDVVGGLVLDAMAFRAEAEVRWLDHAEARIAKMHNAAAREENAR